MQRKLFSPFIAKLLICFLKGLLSPCAYAFIIVCVDLIIFSRLEVNYWVNLEQAEKWQLLRTFTMFRSGSLAATASSSKETVSGCWTSGLTLREYKRQRQVWPYLVLCCTSKLHWLALPGCWTLHWRPCSSVWLTGPFPWRCSILMLSQLHTG